MSASCRGCKRQVVILEGGGGDRRAWNRRSTEEDSDARDGGGARGRGPVTSPATLSTDLGQRAARFIYMHVGEREGAFLFTRARERASERANTRVENSPVTRSIHNGRLFKIRTRII